MSDPFGHWLAGFFDGEGSFGIYPANCGRRGEGLRCMAKVSLRSDDREILEECARWTGVGRIYDDKKGAPDDRHPCSAWVIEGRAACTVLADIFERYPLRAKKARDFAVWAQAVREWCSCPAGQQRPQGWDRMEALRQQLLAVRIFDAPLTAPVEAEVGHAPQMVLL